VERLVAGDGMGMTKIAIGWRAVDSTVTIDRI
jgi:hypothetical protein